MRSAVGLSVIALGVVLLGSGQAQEPKATLLPVLKYKGLGDLVNKQRGKVVLVDFWTLG